MILLYIGLYIFSILLLLFFYLIPLPSVVNLDDRLNLSETEVSNCLTLLPQIIQREIIMHNINHKWPEWDNKQKNNSTQ